MNPVLEFLAPMAASLTGGLVGGKYQSDLAHSREEWALRHSTDLDNTKYQRATADLRAAGLNPMLAYDNGVGPAPQARGAGTPDLARVTNDSVNSGFAGLERGMGLAKLKAEIDLLDSQRRKNLSDAGLADENIKSATNARSKMDAEASLSSILAEIQRIGKPTAKAKADIESRPAYQWFEKITSALEGLVPSMLIPWGMRNRKPSLSPGRGVSSHVNRGY